MLQTINQQDEKKAHTYTHTHTHAHTHTHTHTILTCFPLFFAHKNTRLMVPLHITKKYITNILGVKEYICNNLIFYYLLLISSLHYMEGKMRLPSILTLKGKR